MRIVLAGGSGALGRRLAADLQARGDDVVTLTRSPKPGPVRQVRWDGRTVGPWAAELEGAVVINLAGELVDRRPTAANIELLARSRVEPTRALVDAAGSLDVPPRRWLQMSTLAIYGDAGEAILDEGADLADGPPQMAGVARQWEAAVAGAPCPVTVLRAGVVLDPGTPALTRLTHLTRFGLGGRIGSGRQWVSWIHIDDFLGAMHRLIDDGAPGGVVHVTAPEPVRNVDLMRALRSALHRPWSPPTPVPLVRLGAVFLRTDPALALAGRRCVPGRLLERGYEFRFPTFEEALADLV